MKIRRRTEITIHSDRVITRLDPMYSGGARAQGTKWASEQSRPIYDRESGDEFLSLAGGLVRVQANTVCVSLRGSKEKPLSQAAFDKLLEQLDPDRERAGYVYEIIRAKLIRFFEARGCSSPAEYADKTTNRVAYNLVQGKQIWTDPQRYFYGVARNLLKEYWGDADRRLSSLELISENSQPFTTPNEEAERGETLRDRERQLECLARCLKELSAESRDLILRYYQGEKDERIENRKKLAAEMDIEVSTLRLRAFRMRQSLEARFNELIKTL